MSEQVDKKGEVGAVVPGWIGAGSAWGLLVASVACLASVLLLGNSMSDGMMAVAIGLMMGLGLIAASVGFVWFRTARQTNDSNGQRFGAGTVIAGGLLMFALPLLVFLWVMLIFEGQ